MVSATQREGTLFCFEVYVHKVERLSARLRASPPAFAVQFLDYSPVIVAPPDSPEVSPEGSLWYGQGKRCLFEEDCGSLGNRLTARAASALLCLQIEHTATSKRKMYGSGAVALTGFGSDAPEAGAVRTWGRLECRVPMLNPYSRIVGVASLSVSLASFDPTLRAVLAPKAPKDDVEDLELDIDDDSSATGPPPPKSTSPMSPPAPPIAVPPPTVMTGTGTRAGRPFENCVDAGLRMPALSVDAFDDTMQAALVGSLALSAGGAPAELLSWRDGSLIVDVRVRFGDDARAARAYQSRLHAGVDFLPSSFGPVQVLSVVAKRCALAAPFAPAHAASSGDPPCTSPRVTLDDVTISSLATDESSVVAESRARSSSNKDATRNIPSPLNDSFAVPAVVSSSSSGYSLSRRHRRLAASASAGSSVASNRPPRQDSQAAPPPRRNDGAPVASSLRTFDVFRGQANIANDDDDLGECPPPLFHDADLDRPPQSKQQQQQDPPERPRTAEARRPRRPRGGVKCREDADGLVPPASSSLDGAIAAASPFFRRDSDDIRSPGSRLLPRSKRVANFAGNDVFGPAAAWSGLHRGG